MAAEVAFSRAATRGDAESLARILNEDPPLLLSSTWNGDTLLRKVVRWGHVAVVRLLLERGADINVAGAFGNTALHYAAQSRREEVVSLLLSSGADPSRTNNLGRTALINASIQGHVAMVRLLLRSMGGHGLDQRDFMGQTALSIARSKGCAEIVLALLLNGADHNTTAESEGPGWAAQQVAHQGHHRCLALLQWWEGELQRASALHKARALHDNSNTHQQAPAAPVPVYLTLRAAPGGVMPSVEVGALEQGGQGGKHDESVSREAEVRAMVGFVVKDLTGELYIELLEGLHH